MKRLLFRCQHCDKAIKAHLEIAGQNSHCPNCGRAIVVPPDAKLIEVAPPETPPARRPPDDRSGEFFVPDMFAPVLYVCYFCGGAATLLLGMFLVMVIATAGEDPPTVLLAVFFAAVKTTFWSAMGLTLIEIYREVKRRGGE